MHAPDSWSGWEDYIEASLISKDLTVIFLLFIRKAIENAGSSFSIAFHIQI